jgi:ferric-dicitrate binding protein FerR (iron transport regulator)
MPDIDELIVRLLQGAATEDEQREVAVWRNTAPGNERYFREIAAVWQTTAEAATPASPRGAPAGGTLRAIAQRLGRSRRRAWRSGAVAAATVAGVAIAAIEVRRQDIPLPVVAYATGPTESLTLTLPDRSIVRLGPQTVLEYRAAREREVRLEGRAFFGVARDDGRPFVVRTPLGVARVRGTRFNLTATSRALDLVVVEGRVELSANAASLEVRAGQAGRVTPSAPPALRTVADLKGETRWIGRVLIFQETPLPRALREIEQHYARPISLVDTGPTPRTVTAVFSEQTFADVVTTVCRVVDVPCTVDAAHAVVGR